MWPDASLERIAAVIAVHVGGGHGNPAWHPGAAPRRAVIVNTASTAALRPLPTDPVYWATKAAVVRVTESCADFAAAVIELIFHDTAVLACQRG